MPSSSEMWQEVISGPEARALYRAGRAGDAVRLVMRSCYPGAAAAGPGEAAGLVTALVHRLLAEAHVPSQRKASHRGVEVDVAVPGLRGLDANPGGVLLVCIPGTSDPAEISRIVGSYRRIQPVPGNVWAVLPGPGDAPCRSFTAGPDGGTLPGFLESVRGFAGSRGPSLAG
ncbi:hypothetical protein IBTHAUMO2_990063 [Nitrosopumilaceae archaeon]|nr:hypothetical protein [Nitrosopumilus sp.]CAI9832831.1 hypothetical protein IBTHAUMO2_990063 [Nitrosopumilaceae archaeon]